MVSPLLPALEFRIDWHGAAEAVDLDDRTIAFLSIYAGQQRINLTEVHDSSTQSIRPGIYVPAIQLAWWLLANWWRLRWESRTDSENWGFAHSLTAAGDGIVWPPLAFQSDGEFLTLRQNPHWEGSLSTIRFLNHAQVAIPAACFEEAVDSFLGKVNERLGGATGGEVEFREGWAELRHERSTPELALRCKRVAMAGMDPEECNSDWMIQMEALASQIGPTAIDEVLTTAESGIDGLVNAQATIETVRESRDYLDLSWLPAPVGHDGSGEQPWQRGERLATLVRQHLGLNGQPFTTPQMAELLGINPLTVVALPSMTFDAGYRRDGQHRQIAFATHTSDPDGRRFCLARLLGSSLVMDDAERLLPATRGNTALQKLERAFATELLCPWLSLEDFIGDHAPDPRWRDTAAKHFGVSERLITTKLVNKKALPREFLDYQS